MIDASDNELVRRSKNNDLAAFEALVSRHERRIYGLALRLTNSEHDAQDVTQQAFISALEYLSGFRGAAAFSTWLTRIAVNAALKLLRKRAKSRPGFDESSNDFEEKGGFLLPEHIADWRESPDKIAQHAETRQLLDQAMATLSSGQRAVFMLRDVEGFSVADTAATLGLTQENVKVRLLRARLALREQLTCAFGDPLKKTTTRRHARHADVAAFREEQRT